MTSPDCKERNRTKAAIPIPWTKGHKNRCLVSPEGSGAALGLCSGGLAQPWLPLCQGGTVPASSRTGWGQPAAPCSCTGDIAAGMALPGLALLWCHTLCEGQEPQLALVQKFPSKVRDSAGKVALKAKGRKVMGEGQQWEVCLSVLGQGIPL